MFCLEVKKLRSHKMSRSIHFKTWSWIYFLIKLIMFVSILTLWSERRNRPTSNKRQHFFLFIIDSTCQENVVLLRKQLVSLFMKKNKSLICGINQLETVHLKVGPCNFFLPSLHFKWSCGGTN